MEAARTGHRLPMAEVSYARLELQLLARSGVRLPAALLLMAMVVSAVLAQIDPAVQGYPLPAGFVIATLLRAVAALYLSMVILRLALGSPRPAWLPDGGSWLFALLFILSLAVPALVGIVIGSDTILAGLLVQAIAMLIVSLFAAWIVAAAVARPLAWNARAWLRDFGRWLPQRIGWGLLLVPFGIAPALLARVDDPSLAWLAAVGSGVLGFLALMIRLGLDAAAYRRVALD